MTNNNDNERLQARQRERQEAREERQAQEQARKRQLPMPALVALGVAFLVVLILFARFCSSASTISVTVNNMSLTLHGAKTMETAIRESGLPINPGDLISLNGAVLKRSEGHPFYATVNGEETVDPNQVLRNGDEIQVSDGKDIVEDYDVVVERLPHEARIGGYGTICTFTEHGTDGEIEHRTGRLSGEKRDVVITDTESGTAMWYLPDVGGDKVIALTFDEGPSEYTDKILDVLAENDAQATFFFVGEEALEHPDQVKHASDLYYQIGTNTYDREITTGTSHEWLEKQVHDGLSAIAEALGGQEPSRIVRFPKAELTSDMAAAVDGEADAVIGWSLDTGDWMENNANEVYEVLMAAEPGDIVLLRDGGGNRTNTVNALKRALPELKEKGYKFITIDQLMQYPAKTS